MKTSEIISGNQIYLRQITIDDCDNHYVAWLNDPEVNQYLETKWSEQNIDTIQSFVESQIENKHSVLFAIIAKDKKQHIGNIKIGPVHPHYKHADISCFIGEKEYWHRGVATEAIKLVCKYGFEKLSLHRIEAGTYDCAIGGWKALEKCGFRREGIFQDQVIFHGEFIDIYRYGLLNNNSGREFLQ